MSFDDGALFLALDLRPITDRPLQFADAVRQLMPTRKRALRKADECKLRQGIARLAGRLVLNHANAEGGWSFRSFSANTFTRQPLGYRQFIGVKDTLIENGLLEVATGKQRPHPFADGKYVPLYSSRLRPTAGFLELARSFDLTPESIFVHYTQEAAPLRRQADREVLELRAASVKFRADKFPGLPMDFALTPPLMRMANQIKDLNRFLRSFEITGPSFVSYYRVFNNGDRKGFAWNKGGRLYARGGFQNAGKQDRLRMMIGGSPVVEIDITASHLTIYAAMKGHPLPTGIDPYIISDDLSRAYVKAWFTVTLGLGSFLRAWPSETARKLRQEGLDIGGDRTIDAVGERILAAYPFLVSMPEDNISWADLQFIESEAVFKAMLHLKDAYSIPALSVFDSIIVKETDAEPAQALLMDHYAFEVGVYPMLKVKRPDRPSKVINPEDRKAMKPALVAAPKKIASALERTRRA
ncbi:MAG: hypothetical protein GC201_09720 [Alphaproteobacteria bacterium]|nr:hypothetical protein [Alphaproteobacteria bacterium]